MPDRIWHTLLYMTAPVLLKNPNERKRERRGAGLTGAARKATGLNPEENTDPKVQQRILDALPVLVFLERAGRIIFANAEARLMLGVNEEEWVERPVEDVIWGLFPGTAEPQTRLAGTKRGSPFHATLPSKDGRLLPLEGTYSILNAELREAVIVAHPGGQERAPKSRLVEDVLASIPEAVAIEHSHHILYTNPAFTRMFGYTAEEASGASLREMIVPETRLNEHMTLEKAVDEHGRATVETVRVTKAGDLVDVSMQIAPLLVDGAQVGYVFSFRDAGEQKETEAKLQHDAMHDTLTGLPNRALFLDRLTLALSRRARRPDQTCGVLFFDLDRFKEINDALGHAAGDVLLKSVAERLQAVLRPQDSAARLGGDEFAVLVENILSAGDLEAVANRILREMERPVDIFGRFVQAGASIGVAMAGAEHTVAELLIRDADFAMYRAKQTGGARYEIFDRHLAICVTSRQERERELRQILDQRLFEIRYQPVYRLADGRLEGFESQLFFRQQDAAMEDLRDLLAVAEETGLSIALGRETLEDVCRQLQDWSGRLAGGDLTVAVNLTPRQFYHPDLVAQLKRSLTASGADPSRLLFEVPEGALNENPDAAVVTLQRMMDCGVRAAVDNFGSHLAPLNHLVRLPLSLVKLDAKLTASAAMAGRQGAVLEPLIRLGRALGVRVVAQGIETPEQLKALIRLGCPSGQGPLLSLALEPAWALKQLDAGYWAIAS